MQSHWPAWLVGALSTIKAAGGRSRLAIHAPATARSRLRTAGRLTRIVLIAPLSAIAMAAKGKASFSDAMAAVASPCPAPPIARPLATGELTLS